MSGTLDRVSCDVVDIDGADATALLDSQLSQSVAAMDVGSSCWSLLLEPDGHFGDWLRVVRMGPERWVVLGALSRTDAIIERLGRFKLRERAALSVSTVEVSVVAEGGSLGGLSLPPIWANHGEIELMHEPGGAVASDEARSAFEQRRIAAGRLSPEDLVVGDNPYAIGAGNLARAVSFTKGCYTGQELVARMNSRSASAPRRLVIGQTTGSLDPGTVLRDGAKEVGVVRTSVNGGVGVCLVARSVSASSVDIVTGDGAPVTISEAQGSR